MLRINGQRIGLPPVFRSTINKLPFSQSAGPHLDRQPWPQNMFDKLRIGKHTRVIYQGFTGRVATQNARESLEYGTNIVGGVTSGKEGEHLGLPLLPTMQMAKDQLKPDATAVFVPSGGAPSAIQEAIEAEIPLIVAVAEHIPVHDMMRVYQMLRTTERSILVGPNSPGIISPLGSCRIGFQPLPIYSPGHIGVIARSGTLSYETVASLTRAGLGQSICIGVGGDCLAGIDMVEAHRALQHHDETHAIVMLGELGGRDEEFLADEIADIRDTKSRLGLQDKPVYACVVGAEAPRGRIMGHAGAFRNTTEPSVVAKRSMLSKHGFQIVSQPEDFGPRIRQDQSRREQRRTFHSSHRPMSKSKPQTSRAVRHLHLARSRARDLFTENGLFVEHWDGGPYPPGVVTLGIHIHRKERQAALYVQSGKFYASCLGLSPAEELPEDPVPEDHWFFRKVRVAMVHGMRSGRNPAIERLSELLGDANAVMSVYRPLWGIFRKYEALQASVHVVLTPARDALVLFGAEIRIDDSALKIPGRLDVARNADYDDACPIDVAAEQHGIVYVTLNRNKRPAVDARVATIANGAGLAMNTVDGLAAEHKAPCVNFLDTGGKATADTVRRCFELVLRDERTRVIFVNIFGGLTDAELIANGIVLAFKEVDIQVPVVVRLRGTNEEKGQKVIAESGLGLEVFDSFRDAAARVAELAYPERANAAEVSAAENTAAVHGAPDVSAPEDTGSEDANETVVEEADGAEITAREDGGVKTTVAREDGGAETTAGQESNADEPVAAADDGTQVRTAEEGSEAIEVDDAEHVDVTATTGGQAEDGGDKAGDTSDADKVEDAKKRIA